MTPRLRSPGVLLAGILLLAFGLRLAFVLSWIPSAYHQCPILDASTLQDLARTVTREGPAGLGLIWRPPLYPVALGLLWRVLGEGTRLPLLLQVLLSTLSVFLVHRLGRRVLGEVPALGGAALLAVSWTSIFFTGQMLITTLFTTLCLATLVAVEEAPERGLRGALVAGILAGLAVLARPTLLPCVLVWALWLGRRAALPFLGACLLLLAPVTFQNYRASGLFIPLSAIGGYNFFIGNGPGADGKTVWAAEPALEALEIPAGANPLEIQDRYLAASFEHVRGDPGRWLGLMGRKFFYLVNSHEIASNVDIYSSVSAVTPWLAFLAFLPFGILFPFAVLGFWHAAEAGKAWSPLGIFVVVFPATLLLFFVNARYRVPLVPAVCLYAALGAESLWARRGELAGASRGRMVLLLALLGLCNLPAFGVSDPRDTREVDLRHAAAFLAGGHPWEARVMAEQILVEDLGCLPARLIRTQAMRVMGHLPPPLPRPLPLLDSPGTGQGGTP